MTPRTAVRILLVDPAERILLLRLRGGWWITVGGGIETGESPVEAAVREVQEETGLAITAADVGPPVWVERELFTWHDVVYDQRQSFHLVRCPVFEPSLAGLMADEVSELVQWRWWTVAELLEAADPQLRPQRLAELLPEVLAGPWDRGPMDLGTGDRR